MKTTGITRRIDSLGRIVIPKEIRKVLKIRDGEMLEIFVDNGQIILSKYSKLKDISDMAKICITAINENLDTSLVITDRDKVVGASFNIRKKYLEKDLSTDMNQMLVKHSAVIEKDGKPLKIVDDEEGITSYAIYPIIVDGDIDGLVIALGEEKAIDDTDEKVAQITSKFLSYNA